MEGVKISKGLNIVVFRVRNERNYNRRIWISKERDLSELERELGNIKIIQNLPDALEAYRGCFVEMLIDDANYIGIVQGKTGDGGFILKPTIHRSGPISFEEKASVKDKNIWLDEPIIVYGTLRKAVRASEEVLTAVAHGFDRVRSKGKYLNLPEYTSDQPSNP